MKYILSLALLIPSALGAIGDSCSKAVLGTTAHGTCQKTSNCASGATVQGLCPNDPSDVRCCFPSYPCQVDTFPGSCQNTKSPCGGNRYFTDLCPGPSTTKCCIRSDSSVDKFVDFLKTTYTLATQYRSGKSGKASANELVMQWLRHEAYNDIAWRSLLGSVDSDWVSYAKGKGHSMFDAFLDPYFCDQRTETDHLGATMNAVFRFPRLAYPYVNRGDFGGWGGDLVTLYANWQAAGKPAARAYVKGKILGNASSFKMLDAIEDSDGYNIAVALKSDSSKTIYAVAEDYYRPAGGYRTRFKQLYLNRFNGDREHTITLAHEILTAPFYLDPSTRDYVTDGLRIAAVQVTNGVKDLTPMPSTLSAAELRPFLEGFADAIDALIALKAKTCE
ncbi:hypothetical protein BX600DRAFT_63735 [Xylariales sp. PMI_506]|nr:hypothetical protein BX600DRAFT_63735 [Xylariales sp. PMI_506]